MGCAAPCVHRAIWGGCTQDRASWRIDAQVSARYREWAPIFAETVTKKSRSPFQDCGLLHHLKPTRPELHLFHAFDKGFQLAAAAGMAQLAQRLGFDLADALAGDLEALAH